MGTAGKSAKSVHNDREERQQGTSEERIRLVVLRLPLGHESSKMPEFSAEWMVNQEKQALQNLSGAVHFLAWPILRVARCGTTRPLRRSAGKAL